jgi:hypothetical protein
MRDPNIKIDLSVSISVKVEPKVADSIKLMADHMKMSTDEITNTALKRYIATHSDFFPPRKTTKAGS